MDYIQYLYLTISDNLYTLHVYMLYEKVSLIHMFVKICTNQKNTNFHHINVKYTPSVDWCVRVFNVLLVCNESLCDVYTVYTFI